MDWTELDRLEVRDSRWVVAVGNDGRRLRLPMVRPHDLRRLIEVSGGSFKGSDPGQPAEPSAPPQQSRQQESDDAPVQPDSAVVGLTSDGRVAEPAEPSS
jgi:hypothetical protein